MELIAPASWPKGNDRTGSRVAGSATIGALIETGRGLTATCEVCLHSARIDLRDLAMRVGATHSCSAAALRPVLQCSVCKSTEAVLLESGPRHGTARPRLAARIPAYV